MPHPLPPSAPRHGSTSVARRAAKLFFISMGVVIALPFVIAFAFYSLNAVDGLVHPYPPGAEPVRLVGSSGTLERFEFLNGSRHKVESGVDAEGALHIRYMGYFYSHGDFARPYLIQGPEGPELHVQHDPRFEVFQTKCEYVREYEVALSRAQWVSLKTLRLVNRHGYPLEKPLDLEEPRLRQQLQAGAEWRAADIPAGTNVC